MNLSCQGAQYGTRGRFQHYQFRAARGKEISPERKGKSQSEGGVRVVDNPCNELEEAEPHCQEPNVSLETDASRTGWGAVCEGVGTGGPWSRQE